MREEAFPVLSFGREGCFVILMIAGLEQKNKEIYIFFFCNLILFPITARSLIAIAAHSNAGFNKNQNGK